MFKIIKKDNKSKARAGILITAHGEIETPVFMPVGTRGSVKAVHQTELKNDLNLSIILANTYHLYLRPGIDIINKAGGIHKFISWDRAILTDSGGFQVYSLAENRKITEEGIHFKSHIDGSSHFFTPEKVIDIQRYIGADIIMAFDECVAYPSDYEYVKKSVELTNNWLDRCIEHFNKTKPLYGYEQFLFPIVQGGIYEDLRIKSAKYVVSKDLPGNAIGGLSVGEPVEDMYRVVDIVTDILPEEKPRYLMGVGKPSNILEAIARGIDMFDCVIPTRNGRNGMLFTTKGIINIRNKKWETDFSLIDENGISFVDKLYTKAYLRHLMINNEILGAQIATLHNLGFFKWLMTEARNKIIEGNFIEWKNNILPIIDKKL